MQMNSIQQPEHQPQIEQDHRPEMQVSYALGLKRMEQLRKKAERRERRRQIPNDCEETVACHNAFRVCLPPEDSDCMRSLPFTKLEVHLLPSLCLSFCCVCFNVLPQREGDVAASRRGPEILSSACCDYDVLRSADHVRCWSCCSGEWESCLPKLGAGGTIKRTHLSVIDRCTDENESTRGDNRTAVIFGTSVFQPRSREFWILTERYLP
jgi:hypothetical protein